MHFLAPVITTPEHTHPRITGSGLIIFLIVISASSLIFKTSVLLAAEDGVETTEEQVVQAKPAEPMVPEALKNDRALAKQIADSEAKWLQVGDTEFLGIFDVESSGLAFGSILIIPAPGNTPLTSGVLPQLAKELSSKNWHSLGITVPVLDFSGPVPIFPEAETTVDPSTDVATEETVETIDKQSAKAQTFLPDEKKWYADQETTNMARLLERLLVAEAELLAREGRYILLAQGVSAELVLELIVSKVIKPSGFISLAIEHPVYQRSSKIPENMAKITIPILDIYNASDLVYAGKRKARHKGDNYHQLYIPGNDMNFKGSEKLLIKRVKGWLKKIYSKAE